MQVFGLPRHVIRAGAVASRIAAQPSHSEAAIRQDAIARWLELRSHGLTSEQAARGVGHSRSKLYRWLHEAEPKSRRPRRVRPKTWTPELLEAVERFRSDNPMWGKGKIAVLLAREGVTTSASTVGRILRSLMDRGVIVPVPTLRKRPGPRRLRLTTTQRHARRLPKGLKPTRPGEIVQIDTLFVNVRPDKPIKQITAYDPVAKWTMGRVATAASARSATALLDKLMAEAPFRVRGIQVDGGSEFRAEFEDACQARGLDLFVLPPKRPQLNGAVERAQGSWRYEFYASFDLPYRIDKLQEHVDAFAHRFNHHRPHQALGGRTPAEYLASLSPEDPAASHMG